VGYRHRRARLLPDENVSYSAFSADGSRIAITGLIPPLSETGRIVVRDLVTLDEVFRVEAPALVASPVSFSPDGRYVLGSLGDDLASIWNLETGEKVAGLPARIEFTGPSVDFSQDGRRVVYPGYDGNIHIWDLEAGQEVTIRAPGYILHTRFTPDGAGVVSVSNSNQIQIWDIEAAIPVATFDVDLGDAYYVNLSFSGDGKRLVVSSLTGGVLIYSIDPAELLQIAEGRYGTVQRSPRPKSAGKQNGRVREQSSPGPAHCEIV
jgi:WD40 repeat protein